MPRYGNFAHWALCAETEETSKIYEVVGSHGSFTRHTIEARPQHSNRYMESIALGEVADVDFKLFETGINDTIVDNDTSEWDCQDFVLEILDKLEEECIIDGDDKFYQKQKKKIQEKRADF